MFSTIKHRVLGVVSKLCTSVGVCEWTSCLALQPCSPHSSHCLLLTPTTSPASPASFLPHVHQTFLSFWLVCLCALGSQFFRPLRIYAPLFSLFFNEKSTFCADFLLNIWTSEEFWVIFRNSFREKFKENVELPNFSRFLFVKRGKPPYSYCFFSPGQWSANEHTCKKGANMPDILFWPSATAVITMTVILWLHGKP